MKKEKDKATNFKLFYTRLCKLPALQKAWNSVYENGIQSPSSQARHNIKCYKNNEQKNLSELYKKLKSKTFVPKASGFPLEKKGKGTYRPVVSYDINTRIVQRAILNILLSHTKIQPVLNCATSFGGIKHKGVYDAVKEICVLFKKNGFTHYIATDIRSFFTSIKIDVVLKELCSFCKDKDFLDLLEKTMRIEIDNLSEIIQKHKELLEKYNYSDGGVPQGSCLSPLFGNIYLYKLDLELNKNPDIVFLRYIDDIIIIGKNYNDVVNIYRKQLLPNLEKLGLSVYGEKDEKFKKGIFKSNAGIGYLGVNISNNVVKPSNDAIKSIKKEVKILLDETQNFKAKKTKSLYEALDMISRKLKGWSNHYWFCNAPRELKMLDENIDKMISKFVLDYNNKLKQLKEREIRQHLGVYLASTPIPKKTPIMKEIKNNKK